jgi:transcriptional regulator with XRE-family HTH domain
MNYEQLGKLIKTKRETQNISQKELALRSELSMKTIYRIENGLKDPKLSSVFLIAKALNLSLAQLFKEF